MAEIELDESQLSAVKHAIEHRFSIINGGAGCGKTTIIKAIAEQLKRDQNQVKLCSPTGKAAARLKEATGIPASTVHSLLMYNGATFAAGPLDDCCVIVDESSMMDSLLLAELTGRTPKKLILVGDQAQLPPVGPGQPFHDLVELRPETVRTLTTCYRASEAVFNASGLIRAGKLPAFHAVSEREEWSICETGEALATQAVILEWVKKGWFDFQTDIILAPKNGEKNQDGSYPPGTVNGLNAAIIAIVNPREPGEIRRFLPGDRVINTKNNADKDIWNGTTGTVHAVDDDGLLYLKLDLPIVDRVEDGEPIYKDIVSLTLDEQKSLQHAYALTVHKSQGSQYRRVVVVCLQRDRYTLTRSLIYTGVTRTRQACVIVGQSGALAASLSESKAKRTVIQVLNGVVS